MQRLHLVFILLCLQVLCLRGQNVSDKVLAASFEHPAAEHKRSLLHFNKRAAYYNPLNYVGAGLLYVYQNIVSEQIQASCMYQTSCSEYTKLSIQQKGFFIGLFSGFNQWTECFGGVVYEHAPLFVNSEYKIINTIGHEVE